MKNRHEHVLECVHVVATSLLGFAISSRSIGNLLKVLCRDNTALHDVASAREKYCTASITHFGSRRIKFQRMQGFAVNGNSQPEPDCTPPSNMGSLHLSRNEPHNDLPPDHASAALRSVCIRQPNEPRLRQLRMQTMSVCRN